MKQKHFPTRLEFSVQERNAAQRALLRLVTDFSLEILPDEREWCSPLGSAVVRIALEATTSVPANSTADIELPLEPSERLLAINQAGAQLLELLNTRLRMTWSDAKNGPTNLRHAVNRTQVEAVLRVLK